ncbi:MAG: endonuclease domain-containing protein [Nitrospirota bacterium]
MKADNTNNFGYQKNLQPLANDLRKNMTKAEACLWKFVLRAGNMKGYTFRRQRPVLNYIADFMSIELKLIIEVDGITHSFEETIKKDAIRQKELEKAGFTVIRFIDDEILSGIENVRRAIGVTVEEIEGRKSPPPYPRQRGTKIQPSSRR